MCNFKYEEYLSPIRAESTNPCPSEDSENTVNPIFHWVHNPIHEDDFLPLGLLILQGKRGKRGFPRDRNQCCDYFGISMHVSLEKSREHFYAFGEPVRVSMGYTHIVVGEIDNEDGVRTQIDNNGHFNFHPYEQIETVDKFDTERLIELIQN